MAFTRRKSSTVPTQSPSKFRKLPFSPQEVGLPPKFQTWRPAQEDAAVEMLDSTRRIKVLSVPTGGGKTGAYVAAALLDQGRTAIGTATKGLQNQLLDDFASIGLTDVRGRSNFQCVTRPGISCESGASLGCAQRRKTTCPYFAQYADGCSSSLLTTNYSYWTAASLYTDGLFIRDPDKSVTNPFSLLVCDEAHDLPDEITSAAGCEITQRDLDYHIRAPFPPSPERITNWREWASIHLVRLTHEYDLARQSMRDLTQVDESTIKRIMHLKELNSRLKRITTMTGPWVVDSTRYGFSLEPLWPAAYVEPLVFQSIPSVVLTSATVNRKTLQYLGLDTGVNGNCSFVEYDAVFSPERNPLYQVPSVRVSHKMEMYEKRHWLSVIDGILDNRLDRKGIIHTVSYDRAAWIMANSRHREWMIGHGKSSELPGVLHEYLHSRPPAILVSPSVGTGLDFPYDDCEYQIIAKVPFPDSRSQIMQARKLDDSEYDAYLMIQNLVQQVGRGRRTQDDRCENFVVDEQIKWVMFKYSHLTPKWFRKLYQRCDMIPAAPAPLQPVMWAKRTGQSIVPTVANQHNQPTYPGGVPPWPVVRHSRG